MTTRGLARGHMARARALDRRGRHAPRPAATRPRWRASAARSASSRAASRLPHRRSADVSARPAWRSIDDMPAARRKKDPWTDDRTSSACWSRCGSPHRSSALRSRFEQRRRRRSPPSSSTRATRRCRSPHRIRSRPAPGQGQRSGRRRRATVDAADLEPDGLRPHHRVPGPSRRADRAVRRRAHAASAATLATTCEPRRAVGDLPAVAARLCRHRAWRARGLRGTGVVDRIVDGGITAGAAGARGRDGPDRSGHRRLAAAAGGRRRPPGASTGT